jgi:tetratricopeptide (TPR) repeat protein
MRVAKFWINPTLGVLAWLAFAPSAHAESAAWTICAGQAVSPEQRATSCTEVIEDLSEIDERRAVAYSNRGNVFTDQRDLDRAFADLDAAIRLAPGYAPAYNNRGRVHGFREDFSRAIADYDEAIRLDPQLALAYSNRGYVWFQKIEYDRAMADFNKAIALDPELAIAYGNRAFLFQRRRDTAHAIEDFTTQIQLRPGVLSYINRGNVYREINSSTLPLPTTAK